LPIGGYRKNIRISELIWLLWPPIFLFTTFLFPFRIELSGANLFLPFSALFILITLFWLIDNPKIKIYSSHIYMFLFVIVLCISLLHSLNDENSQILKSITYWISWVILLFVFLITSNSLYSLKIIDKLLLSYATVITIFCIVTIWNIFRGMPPADFLIKSPYNFNRNDLAMLINQAFPLFLGNLIFVRKYKLITLSCLLILGYAILLIGSRGGLIGLIIGLFTMIITVEKKIFSPRKKILFILGILLIIIVGIITKVSTIQRLISLLHREENPYLDIARLLILKGSIEMLKENFLLGVGVGRYWLNYPKYIERVSPGIYLPQNIVASVYDISRPPHSLYLRFWLEGGIFALIFLVSVFFSFIRITVSEYKSTPVKLSYIKAYLWGFSVYAISSCIHSLFYEGYMYPIHFFFMGIAFSLINIKKEILIDGKLV
jgi:O-antigen ligase